MGDRHPREQVLAERLRLYGVVAKSWEEMTPIEQLGLREAVEDYDDVFWQDQVADLKATRKELEEAWEELVALKREREEEQKRRETEDVAIVEDGNGGAEITFRGKKIEGVTHARLEWDEQELTRLSLRLRAGGSLDVLRDLDFASYIELTIESTLEEAFGPRESSKDAAPAPAIDVSAVQRQ